MMRSQGRGWQEPTPHYVSFFDEIYPPLLLLSTTTYWLSESWESKRRTLVRYPRDPFCKICPQSWAVTKINTDFFYFSFCCFSSNRVVWHVQEIREMGSMAKLYGVVYADNSWTRSRDRVVLQAHTSITLHIHITWIFPMCPSFKTRYHCLLIAVLYWLFLYLITTWDKVGGGPTQCTMQEPDGWWQSWLGTSDGWWCRQSQTLPGIDQS